MQAGEQQQGGDVPGGGSGRPPCDGFIEVGFFGEAATQVGLAEDASGHCRIVLGGFFEGFAGLAAFGFVLGGQQDEREAVDGILVAGGSGLAVVHKGQFAGGFKTLSGFIGIAHQIDRIRVAFLGQGLCQFDGLGVAAFTEGCESLLGGAVGFVGECLGASSREGYGSRELCG